MSDTVDEAYMRQALALAARAEAEGEVPVGAVVVAGDRVVAGAWNRCIALNDPTAHAELLALRAAGQALENYRLSGATVYVTLEPCAMCAGAMVHARLARLVYGAADPKTGAAGSVFDLLRTSQLNHRVEVTGAVLGEACGAMLREFFRARRARPSPTG